MRKREEQRSQSVGIEHKERFVTEAEKIETVWTRLNRDLYWIDTARPMKMKNNLARDLRQYWWLYQVRYYLRLNGNAKAIFRTPPAVLKE